MLTKTHDRMTGRGRGFGPRGGGRSPGGDFGFGRDGGRGRGGEREAGRGRRRMFDGGELRLVLLKLIADEPRHGYELIKAIEDLTGGAYAPSPGVVYPTLSMLAELELVSEQQSDTARKRFAVTAQGRAHLEEHRLVVDALLARLAEVGAQRARTDGAPIRRAMMNLRNVLQDRLGAGTASDDAMHDIAALIDEVAQKIERLK